MSDLANHPTATLHCPSAQPDMQDAHPFGIIHGTVQETRIAFFKRDAAQALNWRERLSPDQATQVLRFGARCETSRCAHFAGQQCLLGQRMRHQLAPVVGSAPPCLLRAHCRWHTEQGTAVCLRCPQVITAIPAGEGALNEIARPQPTQHPAP